jgi:hypothetical protein
LAECAGNVCQRTYSGLLSYTQYGHQGVAIESRSNGGEWGLLGHYTQKPVYDDRPLAVPGTPESRDYRMR